MRKDDLVKEIVNAGMQYSPYQIFSDWVHLLALSISNSCSPNHDETWTEREKRYADTMNKYTDEEQKKFYKMTAILCEALEENIEDVLGDVYMKAGCYNSNIGQFFTPFGLSELLGELDISDKMRDIESGKKVTLYEPACGGGSTIIGVASILHGKGINYQNLMDVVAQDLDYTSVCMCYAQLSLLGISAVVACGDTLRNPFNGNNYDPKNLFYTPKKVGVLI